VLEAFGRRVELAEGARVLLLAPGPHAAALMTQLRGKEGALQWVLLDASQKRLKELNVPLTNQQSRPAWFVFAQAARLPFKKHSFEAVIALESLYAVRPPWTVLAEFHRMLVPDGKLILFEPQSLGFLSSLRDKVSGPGKRVFPLDEIKFRLGRGDYSVEAVDELRSVAGYPRPAFCIRAIKRENPAEPVPQFLTAKEMMERRAKTIPKGEELP